MRLRWQDLPTRFVHAASTARIFIMPCFVALFSLSLSFTLLLCCFVVVVAFTRSTKSRLQKIDTQIDFRAFIMLPSLYPPFSPSLSLFLPHAPLVSHTKFHFFVSLLLFAVVVLCVSLSISSRCCRCRCSCCRFVQRPLWRPAQSLFRVAARLCPRRLLVQVSAVAGNRANITA